MRIIVWAVFLSRFFYTMYCNLLLLCTCCLLSSFLLLLRVVWLLHCINVFKSWSNSTMVWLFHGLTPWCSDFQRYYFLMVWLCGLNPTWFDYSMVWLLSGLTPQWFNSSMVWLLHDLTSPWSDSSKVCFYLGLSLP